MYKYEKILVGLDHSEIDIDLINAASYMCDLSKAKMVYFVNIIKDINVPEDLKKEFPNLISQAINDRKESLNKLVEKHFQNENVKIVVNVIVDEGQVTKALLKRMSSEKIDLIILGRKNEKKGGGVLVNRIARRASCSLLIIPKGTQPSVKKVLIPTDFSEYSKYALDKGTSLLRKSENAGELVIQNVFQVPVGYHYTGKSFKEFSEIMKDHAKKDFNRFAKDIDLDGLNVNQIYSLDKDEDIISDIYREGRNLEATLIVVGAKGRTATTALFIGSKAEKLIQVNAEIPLLVVRPKGKNAGIIEYLKEI